MAGETQLTCEALLSVRLQPFGETAEEWRTQVRRLENMKELADAMANKARQADWEGENANVTRPYVIEQARQFTAALRQARSLAEICEDGYQRLRTCKTDLETVVAEAEERGLSVASDGTVSSPWSHPGLNEDYESHAEEVAATQEEINSILERAAEADAAIAQALRDIAGDDVSHFNPVQYASLREAQQAYEDAQEYISYAERPGELEDEDYQRMWEILREHAGDPAFAENVALGLGAEGALDFWADATSNRNLAPGSPEWETMAGLQRAFSRTLALATQSDSAEMVRWEHEMVDLGDSWVGDAENVKGFQVMSSLMYTGRYDSDFLLQYGDALVEHDREYMEATPLAWQDDPYHPLNYTTENDFGYDPLNGFLEALGHNPDASTQFFAPPSGFRPNEDGSNLNEALEYLALEREWRPVHGDVGTVSPSLGNALISATTGQPYDSLGDPDADQVMDLRTAETARVMEQVIDLFGNEEEDLLRNQPQLASSIATMTGAYIDDINYWVATESEEGRQRNEDIFNPPYEGHLRNNTDEILDFLGVLGHNETSHSIVTAAQHIYTASALDAYPATVDGEYSAENFRSASISLEAAGKSLGILDEARIDQLEYEEASREEAEQSLMSWLGIAKDSAIAGGVAYVSLAITGATGPAAVVVPLAAGVGGEVVSGVTDQLMSPPEDPGNGNSDSDEDVEIRRDGSARIISYWDNYLANQPVPDSDLDNYSLRVEQAYHEGSNHYQKEGEVRLQ